MPPVSELYSPRRFAVSVVKALADLQLVVVAFPTEEDCAFWAPELFRAVRGLGPLQGIKTNPIYREKEASSELIPILAEMIGRESTNIEDLLRAYPEDPVLMVRLTGQLGPETASWKNIREIINWLKQANPAQAHRKIFIATSNFDDSPLTGMANVHVFRIWNAITWEELRLAAAELLGTQQNEFIKAWMVATYTGACNYDLDLLEQLCDLQSKDLSRVVQIVQDSLNSRAQNGSATKLSTPGSTMNHFWSVPGRFLEDWGSGLLYGMTPERGPLVPWSAYRDDLEFQILRQIWREQVSGLLPMIIETGFELNKIQASKRPKQWKSLCEAMGGGKHKHLLS